jgi:N-acetylmuramoyl-L-alanine amidase
VSTIAYDRSVKNLIAGLNATGHVTHTTHRKTKVTLHHNAARLSHEGVLQVWQTRPASAHFDVDGYGALAQYVIVNEYAWSTGTSEGNQQSISIEMANSAVGGAWPVAETTWREAARLAGWLFARVIGVRPDNSNLIPHHYWKATACAGPYMDSVWRQVVSAAQLAYDNFTNPTPTEDNVQHLILAQDKSTNAVWVGDGMTRRRVADWTEVEGLQYWIQRKGGDPDIHDFSDLRVLGIDVTPN